MPQPSSLINCSDLSSCFQSLYNLLFSFLIAFAFFYFLYGAIEYLGGGANIMSQARGKERMKNAVIGLIIALIVPILLNMISPNIFTATWWIPKFTVVPVKFTTVNLELEESQQLGTYNYPVYHPTLKNIPKEYCEKAKQALKRAGLPEGYAHYIIAIGWQETKFGRDLGKPVSWWSRITHPIECWKMRDIAKAAGYDPSKVPVSSACAMGPFQIQPTTWNDIKKNYGLTYLNNPWDFDQSMIAAAFVFKDKLKKSGGNPAIAIKYYNGKGEAAEKYMSQVLANAVNVKRVCGF